MSADRLLPVLAEKNRRLPCASSDPTASGLVVVRRRRIDGVTAAQQVLADQVHFELSPERWDAFCAALDVPPKEIPALRKLLTEKSIFDGN